MKSVVLGQVVDNYYKLVSNTKTVNQNGEDVTIFEKKPELIKEKKIREWKEICSFKGEPVFNRGYMYGYGLYNYHNELNISEDEEVAITYQKFRADLGELHLYSNKIFEETDIDKEILEAQYQKLLGDFNYAMNTSNEKMKSYCELHGLDMRKADCEKVFKLIYPDKDFVIVDGKVVVGIFGTSMLTGKYLFKADALPITDLDSSVTHVSAASNHTHVTI